LPVAKRESKTARKQRTLQILARLREMYPDSRCSLDHRSPFQLLAATVLSAQCTDALVNRVTPALFAAYPTPEALRAADAADVEALIRSVNYYRTKARALVGLADALVERFGGEVPRTMDALTTLPGVGRKTANVVLGVAFGEADGVVVDTHVKRVSARLRLTTNTDADRVERDLLPLLPREERVLFTHRVIDHGRTVCTARAPRCAGCGLLEACPTGLANVATICLSQRRNERQEET
jgi:endonuclease III